MKIMMVKAAIVALILFGAISDASADWQFTKWGMTPDQVILASGNKAQANAPGLKGGQFPECSNVLVTMDWVSGDMHLPAQFLFDSNRHLCQVELQHADDTAALLRDKYGIPAQSTSAGGVWYSAGGDKITLFLGVLDYTPRLRPNNSGL